MALDLLTILVLRLFVDGLVMAAFFAQWRRHPTVGGPGWWTLAAGLSVLGTLGLGSRGWLPDAISVGVGNTALAGAVMFAWMGLRSHLGLYQPRRQILLALLVFWLVNIPLYTLWPSAAARLTLFSLVFWVVAVLCLRDLHHANVSQRPSLRMLRWLTWLELVALTLVSGVAWWTPVDAGELQGVFYASALLLVFMLDILLRLVICNSMVAERLQQESDRAAQVLQQREFDSRTLVANLSAGVMVFRHDQTLASINSAARRFMGWSQGGANVALPEPTGPGWRMVHENGEPMQPEEMPFERVRDTGQAVADMVVGMPVAAGEGADGSDVRWALCNAYPERDAQGHLRHVVLTFVDISSLRSAQAEQKALQAQLAQSQKMEALGTLAGGVAHDFNNILAAILGNAELARQDLPPFDPARESLHEITMAARRGRELVRQIMAFSRRQPMALSRVLVGDVLSECCALLRPAVPPQVELIQQCPRHIRPIMADATQLGQVLLNLGTNGLHALAGQPGTVSFTVDELAAGDPALPADWSHAHTRGAVRLRVQDTGSGMDEITRSRIFEPFFTTKAVGSGTGLGLPVALGIVQALQGAIEVHTRLGHGTTFALFFEPVDTMVIATAGESGNSMPMAAQTAGTMVAPESPSPVSEPTTENEPMVEATTPNPKHILYLDDDDTLVFLVRRLLERRGYKVTALCDQDAAIEAVRSAPESFDLLMTDYNMPGMSGLEVAKAVLLINPRLPVAVASGYITDELQAEALAAGVTEVVFKTDAVEAFCEVVARLIAAPRSA